MSDSNSFCITNSFYQQIQALCAELEAETPANLIDGLYVARGEGDNRVLYKVPGQLVVSVALKEEDRIFLDPK
jgi:hypothetical protein